MVWRIMSGWNDVSVCQQNFLCLVYRMQADLRSKEHNEEPDPASHDTNRGIRAREHQRQELILRSEHQLMRDRAVGYQRYRHRDVCKREAIKEEDSWLLGAESTLARKNCESVS